MNDNEILSTLKRIEKRLDESAGVSQRQWQYGLGFGGMIASLAVLPHSIWGAVIVFILGYFIMILSSLRKKA